MSDQAFPPVSAEALGLCACDLWQGYGVDPVLRGINVTIPPGKFTAILGPNGCGKSTLLKSLSGLLPVGKGTIELGGVPIGRFGKKALAQTISMLSQGSAAPDGIRVRDLVAQGRYPHRKLFAGWSAADSEAVDRALDITMTRDLADWPLQLLSGGQRQRAWIAMTLAQEARVLMLDEPTTFLDPSHQLEVLSLIRKLIVRRRSTVVAVLHDLNHAAQFADHIILLKSGHIHAEGPAKEVITPGILTEVFGLHVDILEHPRTGTPICVPWLQDPVGG